MASPLGGLVDRARVLDALDKVLRDALPQPVAEQCRLANVRGKRLIFLASSSLVAARLKLLTDTLFQAAKLRTDTTFDQLTVKVARLPSRPPGEPPPKPLSNTAASHLAAAADAVTDPELKDLLQRLASLA